MPIGVSRVGGSKGRPTPFPDGGIILRGCLQKPHGFILNLPCEKPRVHMTQNKFLFLNNDWFYQKGSVSSTTGGSSTGGSMAAKKRRC